MDIKINDNFLPVEDLLVLQRSIIWNKSFPFYLQRNVADDKAINAPSWSWYSFHTLVFNEKIQSPFYEPISRIFFPKFVEMGLSTRFSRIKINFFPHTSRVKVHPTHTDREYGNTAAIFGLNTCNGFTRIKGSGKIKSVSNRFFVFDGTKEHNSTTTSDAKGRFNINFNFI